MAELNELIEAAVEALPRWVDKDEAMQVAWLAAMEHPEDPSAIGRAVQAFRAQSPKRTLSLDETLTGSESWKVFTRHELLLGSQGDVIPASVTVEKDLPGALESARPEAVEFVRRLAAGENGYTIARSLGISIREAELMATCAGLSLTGLPRRRHGSKTAKPIHEVMTSWVPLKFRPAEAHRYGRGTSKPRGRQEHEALYEGCYRSGECLIRPGGLRFYSPATNGRDSVRIAAARRAGYVVPDGARIFTNCGTLNCIEVSHFRRLERFSRKDAA